MCVFELLKKDKENMQILAGKWFVHKQGELTEVGASISYGEPPFVELPHMIFIR